MYGLEKPIGDMKFVVDTRWVWQSLCTLHLDLWWKACAPASTTPLPNGPPAPCPHRRYVAAMVTPGAGRNAIPSRLKRQFAIFHVPPPSEAALTDIFGTLMAGRFPAAACSPEVADVAARLVPLTVALWNRVQARLLPTPTKFHYLFNMRDLSKARGCGGGGGMGLGSAAPGKGGQL